MACRSVVSLFMTVCVCLMPPARLLAKLPAQLAFGNEQLTLHFSFARQRLRLTTLENHLTGASTRLDDARFALIFNDAVHVDGSNSTVADVATRRVPANGMRPAGKTLDILLEPLTPPTDSIKIHVVFEVRAGEPWIEQHFEAIGPVGQTITRVIHADWSVPATVGPVDEGRLNDNSLGYPDGCGQPVYLSDAFVGIMHPGAENFRTERGLRCAIPAAIRLVPDQVCRTHTLVIGVAARGRRRRAFVRFLYAVRQRPARMVFLVNDWYWKNKSHTLASVKALAAVKQRTGVPIDSFTLDDGWSTYTDLQAGLWGALNATRFHCSWRDLVRAAGTADMNVSLWFGPIGGYSYRPKRLPMARQEGFEINGDKLCLAGTKYHAYVCKTFARWAQRGMDYIKVDGFWPNCRCPGHGHPIGPAGPIAQMDSLRDAFQAWRAARPNLLIGYTSGSNPSPFWLLSADYLWRGGADDAHQGVGTPFDRYTTFVDRCLQLRRHTEVPMSAFVTFDLISRRILPTDADAAARGFWWSAARGSLNHDWYLDPSDLTDGQWRVLAQAAKWAKPHVDQFKFARMIGGDVRHGEIYGFASFDGKRGVLALRNPTDKPRQIQGTLADWLEMVRAERGSSYRVTHVFGQTGGLVGAHKSDAPLTMRLAPLQVAIVELVSATQE